MPTTCRKCSTNCVFKEPKNTGEVFGFPCDFCKKVLCKGCTGISSTEIRCLVLSTRNMPYLCSDCIPGIRSALTLKDRVCALENTLSEVKLASSQKIEELEKQVGVLSDEFKSLTTSFQMSFDDIKKDLAVIKQTTSASTARAVEGGEMNYSAAVLHGRVLQEVSERQKRSCNLMLFNFPQLGEEDDLSRARALLSDLTSSPINIIGASRIGKRNKNGHQSLRLALDSAETVHRVLRSKKDMDRSRRIFLEADLTAEQRSEVNALKNELKERQRNGEPNLALKYINGVPKLAVKN